MNKIMFSILVLLGLAVTDAHGQSKQDTARYHYKSRIKENWVKVNSVDIPEGVQRTLRGSEYEGWTVLGVYRNDDSSEFKVELTKSGETKTYWFDLDGNRLHLHRKKSS